MTPRIRTAVIPAAGLGTRLLPLTKSVPKEMLPVLDRPMIHYAVQELAEAGIEHIVLVTSRGKAALEGYFDRHADLEETLRKTGKDDVADELRQLSEMARITLVRQAEQRGLGHAVLCARTPVGDEPFVVYLPDDLILADDSSVEQMLRVWERYGGNVVAVEEVPRERVSAYGIVKPQPVEKRVSRVEALVEKPPVEDAPSNLAIVGRYVLTPQVFDALERTQPGAIGEVQLTDALALLLERQAVHAYRFQGTRLDCGTPLGLLRASLEVALRREDTAAEARGWLRELG